MKKAYSYHTFILPFIWEDCECNDKTLETFVDCFESNPYWENVDMKNEHHMNSSKRIVSYDDSALLYKEYQYFHPFVRQAIYGFERGIVRNYSFMPHEIRNKANYYISKDDNHYKLLVNGVNLKIFNTGIALFILECENHGVTADGKPQNTIEAVKNINDYGRRISLPFFPYDPKDSVCADKLSLVIDGVAEFSYDAKKFLEKLDRDNMFENDISLTYISDFIKELLSFKGKYRFTSKAIVEPNSFYIYSALDDRMFVACHVCDPEVANRLRTRDADGNLVYTYDADLSKELYELVFIDPAQKCSCYSKEMREKLLEDHLYKRWIDEGSIYSFVNHGMLCITNRDEEYLLLNFLAIYIQMSCLVLVQRASLLNFRRKVSCISNKMEENGKTLDIKTIGDLLNLQEKFIAFRSQLHFIEVSSEEQGIEMYNMMYETFMIERELSVVKEQLDSLYDAANTTLDYDFNKWATVFAIVSVILAIADIINSLFFAEAGTAVLHSAAIIVFLTSIILSVLLLKKYKRKK